MHVQKPARYVGGEWNSVMKNHADVDVKVALVFPDVYEVGMSHLGLKIIYSVINSRKDALAERVYFFPYQPMVYRLVQPGHLFWS